MYTIMVFKDGVETLINTKLTSMILALKEINSMYFSELDPVPMLSTGDGLMFGFFYNERNYITVSDITKIIQTYSSIAGEPETKTERENCNYTYINNNSWLVS